MSLLRISRTKQVQALHFHHDLGMMMLGFGLAFLFCVALFELLNIQFHWIGGAGPGSVNLNGFHGAAQTTQETFSGSRLIFSAEKNGPGYTVPGQKDVPLLKFTLSPASDGFVRGLTFTLDDLAHPFDLKSLKLFLGDESLGEVAFFEGKGTFANLMVKLSANKLMQFSVLGTISDQAQTGDRLKLKVSEMKATDSNGNDFGVQGGPMSGPAISVVRGRI